MQTNTTSEWVSSDSSDSVRSPDIAGPGVVESQTSRTPYHGVYAPSGIDMMSILLRVYQRPNPKIELGAVDSDCAIILCDTFAEDSPIVYCSTAFEVLTGYQRHEILGRNCRFLQSPLGLHDPRYPTNSDTPVSSQQVDALEKSSMTQALVCNSEREDEIWKMVELNTVLSRKEEAQVIITNYRKGGSPFQNILTTIPIRWDDDSDSQEMRYVVGFQADQKTLMSG